MESNPAPHLPPAPERKSFPNPFRRIPLVHLIFAGLLAVCVCFGYIPSNEPPKADLTPVIEVDEGASAETIQKIGEQNKTILKENALEEKRVRRDLAEYEKGGKAAGERRIAFFRFTAASVAVLWLLYCVVAYVLRPVLKFIGTFLGPDFAAVITPLALLGISSVLAKVTLDWTSKGITASPSWVAAWQQFVIHILHPACEAVIGFANIVFTSWVAGTAYLLVVIFVLLKKFFRTVD